MNKPILVLAILLFSCFTALAATPTMRLDYYHTGDATQEVFSVDRVVIEPLPWPGDPKQAIDSSNLGKYLFEVRDAKSKQLLYSRGFASIYGEWETTDEAKTTKRTFQESLRFPEPAAPVTITLKKRDAKNVFQDIWTTAIDPADQFVDRSKPVAPAPLVTIQKAGDPETKVDLLKRSSPRRHSRRIVETSTSGDSARPQLSQASRVRQRVFIATHRSAPLTMLLGQNVTS
jgi:hypothetical protein